MPFENMDYNKYFIGAQRVMPVYGIGEVTEKPSLKVSLRVGKALVDDIKKGRLPDLATISKSFDNIPGGLHALSAAVIIPEESYEEVIKHINDFVENWNS